MEETIFHKFTQHADLQAELLATGDAELVEVHFPRVPNFDRPTDTLCVGF
jgi:hypothetical protein